MYLQNNIVMTMAFNTRPDVTTAGTANVIDACIANSVPRLVLTSTESVVIGYDDIIDGDETLPEPRDFLFPGYSDTKIRAEKMVLSANGTQLSNGRNAIHIVPLSCILKHILITDCCFECRRRE